MAFAFSSQNIQLSGTISLPDGDWTIAGKVRFPSGSSGTRVIFQHGGGYSNHLRLRSTNTGTPNLTYHDDDGSSINFSPYSANFASNTNWRSVALVRTGNQVRLWIDGSSVWDGSNANIDAISNLSPIYFGEDGAGGASLGGELAEWAMWTRALSETELDGLHNGLADGGGISPNYYGTNLVWYIPMYGGDYTEKIAGLTVTNDGSTSATHPNVSYPLSVPLLSSPVTLYTPTLAASNTIAPPNIDSSMVLYTPSFVSQAQTLAPPLITLTMSLFTPSLVFDQLLEIPSIDSEIVLYPPTFISSEAIAPPLLSAPITLFAPTLTTSNTIVPPHIGLTFSLFAPTLSSNYPLSIPRVDVPMTLYAPGLVYGTTIAAPHISAPIVLHTPALAYSQGVVAPLIALTFTLYSPSLREVWELVTPNTDSAFEIVPPNSGSDFTLVI